MEGTIGSLLIASAIMNNGLTQYQLPHTNNYPLVGRPLNQRQKRKRNRQNHNSKFNRK